MSTDCWILRQGLVIGVRFHFWICGEAHQICLMFSQAGLEMSEKTFIIQWNQADHWSVSMWNVNICSFLSVDFEFHVFHVSMAGEWIAISKDSAFPFAKRGESWERMTGTAGSAVPPRFLNEHLYLHQQLHLHDLHQD